MDIKFAKLKATVTAVPNLSATVVVVRAGGVVATLKVMAEATATALAAAIYAPELALGVQAQLLKASALTGYFLKVLYRADETTFSDAVVYRLQRSLDNLAEIADEARITLGKGFADGSALTDANILTVIKGLMDEVGFSDAIVMAIDRRLDEPMLVADPIGKAFTTSRDNHGMVDEGPSRDPYAIDYFATDDYAYSGRPHLKLIKGLADNAGNFTDSYYKQFTKGLVEPLALTETLARDMHRYLADSMSVTDDLDGTASAEDDQVMSYRKVVTNLFAVSDSVAFVVSFVRTPADEAGVTDLATAQFNKGLADQPGAAEQLVTSLHKPLANTSAVSEAAAKSLARALSDAGAVADAALVSTNKGLSDAAALVDAAHTNMTKVLVETTGIEEDKLFALSKPLADSGTVGDAVNKTFGAAKADTASTSDAGTVRMQSYCDITYFAEDYVGISFTF